MNLNQGPRKPLEMDDEEAEIAKQLLEAAYILPRTVDVAEVQYMSFLTLDRT